MSTIIAAHFQRQDQIEDARTALLAAGCAEQDISAFYVNPPGQHDITPIGGDRITSPGAKEAHKGMEKGMTTGGIVGAVLGAATMGATGPLGPLVGALVGAHVGSLYSFSRLKEAGEAEAEPGNVVHPRHAGMLIAVAVQPEQDLNALVQRLRELGAQYVERANGQIKQGDWIDFNPLSTPEMLP